MSQNTPKIYVVCLAAYNNGKLHGVWIEANQPAEAIWDAIRAMLKNSPERDAEEWVIHDYEGFYDLNGKASNAPPPLLLSSRNTAS